MKILRAVPTVDTETIAYKYIDDTDYVLGNKPGFQPMVLIRTLEGRFTWYQIATGSTQFGVHSKREDALDTAAKLGYIISVVRPFA